MGFFLGIVKDRNGSWTVGIFLTTLLKSLRFRPPLHILHKSRRSEEKIWRFFYQVEECCAGMNPTGQCVKILSSINDKKIYIFV